MESNDKLEQFLRQMYAKESLHKEKDIYTTSIIDEEWAKFEAKHFNNPKRHTLHSKLFKYAAMFIGVLMLSGIAYAAIHYFNGNPQRIQEHETMVESTSQTSNIKPQTSDLNRQPSTPIVFEDAELVTILQEIATFYECETIYKNEKVKHVRLYFTWDNTKTIDEIVETFNKFERFHITRENHKLIVE